ncbi:MAG: hypothetical protein H6613_08220 [Ignavibacteriales bacterium]|nr:hypothetical protein [Ignavibacteriales bacterium]
MTTGGKGIDVALQSNGKNSSYRQYYNWGVDDDFAVIRYNSDGSLDTSFDSDGIVTTNISFGMILQKCCNSIRRKNCGCW